LLYQFNSTKKATELQLGGDDWESDISFLSQDENSITHLQVYTQALIHSNLFDSYVNRNQNLKTLSISEMIDVNYKKPFVCFIDSEGIYFIDIVLAFYIVFTLSLHCAYIVFTLCLHCVCIFRVLVCAFQM
jgi:hypothetical protein